MQHPFFPLLQMATERNNALLADEIIINILKRLPVKSLIRFQCVCKAWKNLFKTPSFIADHLHHSHHNNSSLVLKLYRGDIYFLSDNIEILKLHRPPSINFSGGRIVGSSNGLLCVLVKGHATGSQYSLLLWNPAIREVRQVLAENINPSSGSQIFGFGFSPIVNDYKILRLYCDFLMRVNRVEVYSLSTESWKQVVEFGTTKILRQRKETVIANGSMFWLGEENGRILVVSFDIAMEVFKLIPIPSLTRQPHNITLCVCENKLAMFHNYFVIGNFEFSFLDIWMIEEEDTGDSGKSWIWTKKYSLGQIPSILYPICIWKNENIVCDFTAKTFVIGARDSLIQVGYDNCLYLLNITTNELKMLPNFLHPYDHPSFLNYAESLVSVVTPMSNCLAKKPSFLRCIYSSFHQFWRK